MLDLITALFGYQMTVKFYKNHRFERTWLGFGKWKENFVPIYKHKIDYRKVFDLKMIILEIRWSFRNRRGMFRFLNKSYLWGERFGSGDSRLKRFLDYIDYPKFGF